MSGAVFPTWVFVAVALAIAAAAFAVGQLHAGAGMIVAGLGSALWTAYVAQRGARMRARHD
ncbi:hypothetical protein [Sphingomonas sp. NFR15]|uniref:hypothetical protein n=1 Tax=Sphingomonas sp. NFR15 TaxID=1566282 RepID=UPI0008890E0E|nr:hypothetical protein [Sphingomonas sp. NFR15]SDA15975.1 hypothetical protein SAMN03159340_00785 [Sphingomonas sp. NFR15]